MSILPLRTGAAYERMLVGMLIETADIIWRGRVCNRDGDSDVACDGAVLEQISIECRHTNTLSQPLWWRQALHQAGAGVPVLAHCQTDAREESAMINTHHVRASHGPVAVRHTAIMGWETATLWMREKSPSKIIGSGYI